MTASCSASRRSRRAGSMAIAALLCCSTGQLPPAILASSYDSSLCFLAHDAAVGCCLSALLGLADAPLPQPARAARLVLRFGGLGLRAADTDCHAAYWAFWMDTLPVIQARVPPAAERLLAALRDDRAARLPSLLVATQAAAYLTDKATQCRTGMKTLLSEHSDRKENFQTSCKSKGGACLLRDWKVIFGSQAFQA